jgi:hypothetical protein
MGLGMAASAAGGAITRNSALSNAQSQAAARNGALSETISGLDNIYNKTNAPAFNSAVVAVTPGGLQTAQDARVANDVGAITKPNIYAPPPGGDTPPAVANAYKGDLADAFNFATNEATNAGKLGGYGDQWLNSNLTQPDAARKIGIGNSNAGNLKSLLPPNKTSRRRRPTRRLARGAKSSRVAAVYSAATPVPTPAPTVLSCRLAPAACSRRRRLQCSGRTAAADLSAAKCPPLARPHGKP